MKLATQILLAFAVVIILSVIDTFSNYLLSVKVKQNTEFLNKSETIIRNSSNLHTAIIEMQSAFRGYLLTDDPNFLDNYDKGLEIIPVLMAGQKELIKNNPLQYSFLDSIKNLHERWIDYGNTLIEARQKSGLSQSSKKIYYELFENKLKKQVGKKINDDIASKFQEFDKIEYKLRSMHSSNLFASIDRTHTMSFTFFGLTIIIGIVSTIYIVRLISKRIKMHVQFAESISQGQFVTVEDTGNDELTSLTKSLNIMSQRLSKNIRELENRNVELNKFAYVVSHDLKAPIRGITNVIKWIEEDLSSEISLEMRKYLDIIPQRTKRMEDLINGLLNYARISERTQTAKTDSNSLVREIADSIVPRNFSVQISNMPILNCERIRLEQVFSNLISNAVKYTSTQKGVIIIDCTETEGHYQFSVKDNGIGIEPEYHGKIFEIFQTLREKDEKESTGIGLAIVKKIIEEQNGIIYINSKLGQGSEFVFTWPKNKKTL